MKVIAATTLAQMALAITVDKSTVGDLTMQDPSMPVGVTDESGPPATGNGFQDATGSPCQDECSGFDMEAVIENNYECFDTFLIWIDETDPGSDDARFLFEDALNCLEGPDADRRDALYTCGMCHEDHREHEPAMEEAAKKIKQEDATQGPIKPRKCFQDNKGVPEGEKKHHEWFERMNKCFHCCGDNFGEDHDEDHEKHGLCHEKCVKIDPYYRCVEKCDAGNEEEGEKCHIACNAKFPYPDVVDHHKEMLDNFLHGDELEEIDPLFEHLSQDVKQCFDDVKIMCAATWEDEQEMHPNVQSLASQGPLDPNKHEAMIDMCMHDFQLCVEKVPEFDGFDHADGDQYADQYADHYADGDHYADHYATAADGDQYADHYADGDQ